MFNKTMKRTITLIIVLAAVVSLAAQSSCGSVNDYDGNSYKTVKIGKQCWMAENLRTTHYADGKTIRHGGTNNMSYDTPYYYFPKGKSDDTVSTGLLYNWRAVMRNERSSNAIPSGVQGVCPAGWHVPSMAEWFQLFEFVGNQSEYLCGDSKKDIAKAMVLKEGWDYSSSPCSAGDTLTENNATGFSAVPAGDANNLYSYYGSASFFWSASTSHFSKESQGYAEGYSIWHDETFYRYHGYDKRAGFSVRCLRD